jgi:hypothetical protein
MLNKGKKRKVLYYRMRQAVKLVKALRPQGVSSVVRLLIGSTLAKARL